MRHDGRSDVARHLRIAVLGSLAAASGCIGYTPEPPERPAPTIRIIKNATILSMEVHLYKQIGLCPGLEGKLYANANVQWPGSKPVGRAIGMGEDSLQPSDFVVTGTAIKGDENAHLFPDPDVRKTIATGYDATIVYKPDPAKWTFKLNFPPEYSCYSGWFEDGKSGGAGNYGGDGGNNGDGTDGTDGGPGGGGYEGGQGGKITAYVTIVATPYWPRLYAVFANSTFFLAPADRDLTFGAAGGQGGPGGNGGAGGNGGNQPTEARTRKTGKDSSVTEIWGTGPAGRGGNGNSGGKGGRGGKGGTVEVFVDQTFPEIARFIKTDVSGGAGGYGGARGGGGYGGQTNAEKNAKTGANGNDGRADGNDGDRGAPGTASVRTGNVASKFAGIKGLAIFGSKDAAAMAKQPPQGATQGFGPPSANSVLVAPASSAGPSASAKPGPVVPPGPSAKPGPAAPGPSAPQRPGLSPRPIR